MKLFQKSSYSHKLKNANTTFLSIFVTWLFCLVLFSFGEIIYNGITNQFPENLLKASFWSITLNILFWLKWLFFEYVVYLLLFLVNKKIAKISAYIFIVLIALIHLLLIQYFNTALVPLGADVYGYSIADIQQTLKAAGGLNLLAVVGVIIFIAILVFVLNKANKYIKLNANIVYVFLVLSVITIFTNDYFIRKKINLKSDFDQNLVLNKSNFFYKNSYRYFFPKAYELDIYADSYIGDYEGKEVDVVSFEYLDKENYPFLHKNTTKDVLGSYFKKSTKKPNIVIILVEGLGRAFTNKGAYLGNFTPFLDSLANKSLYWKNFLSQGGRTFAVLPSLTASLPFGKNGYLALGNDMPKHLSLFNILNKNGYQSQYFYGGHSKFDNMKMFLEKNQVSVYDYDSFPTTAVKLPASSTSGFSWGYSDKALFKHYLNTTKITNKPTISVLLTVATHSPFLVENQEKYNQRFEQRLEELNFDENTKKQRRKFKSQFASVLYADDAVKEFINNYKKRPDFKNTIFLITGDHRLPEIPMSSKIDRYHVPLIIYSPLLKRSKTFMSLSTHFDIAPSLLAFLENNYNIKNPKINSFVGSGLDTIRSFRNIHSYPLIQTKTDLNDFVFGKYHLNGDRLFELNEKLEAAVINDDDIKNRIKNLFEVFKIKNQNVKKGTQIIPDSIYLKYAK